MSEKIDSLLFVNKKIIQLENALSILENEFKITSSIKDSLMSENIRYEELKNLIGKLMITY